MELELKQKELAGHQIALETTLFSEETLECIVPDSCPDILRIVDCDGIVCIQSKETDEGRAEVRGAVKMFVLYLPDGETGLRHMEVTLPFFCSTDHREILRNSLLHVVPALRTADARLLNPRKIYLRAEVALGVQIYTPIVRKATEGCVSAPCLGVQEKKESFRFTEVISVQEKDFTYSDELVIPASKPEIVELLAQRIEIGCGERKVIGNKLIFKGQVQLKLLYRSQQNELITTEFELPFSQIMEVLQAGEESQSSLQLFCQEINCHVVEENGCNKLAVELRILAQAVLREERLCEQLTDLYSTAYQTQVEQTEEELTGVCISGNRRISVREVLETSVAVKSIADFRISIGAVNHRREGNEDILRTEVQASVLCMGEDDELYAVKRSFYVECQVNTDGGSRCCCVCHCPGELYAVPSVGGIELRFPVDFEYLTENRIKVKQVSAAHLDQTQPINVGDRPSIILRMAEKGENLWELAKMFSTTKEEILAANEFADEGMSLERKLLLIPKKR